MNGIHQLLQRCVHCVAVCLCVPYSHKYIQSSPQHFDCRVSGSAYTGTDSQFMNTETACLHGCTLDCYTTNPQSEILYFITFCMTFMCTWQGRTCLSTLFLSMQNVPVLLDSQDAVPTDKHTDHDSSPHDTKELDIQSGLSERLP